MSQTLQQFAEALDELTIDADKATLSDRLTVFVSTLSRHGLLHKSDSLMQAYRRVVQKRLGLSSVIVRTARELTADDRTTVEKQLPSKSDIQYVIDSRLLHGIQVEIDGELVDSTLAGRLQRLSKTFC